MPGAVDFIKKTGVIFEFEVRKLIHDPVEIFVRVVQPILWLVIFGTAMSLALRNQTIEGVPYRDFITPGIMAQSVLFTSIFFGIAITWDRDSGILAKLSPTSRGAIVLGKALSAAVRGLVQSIVIIIVAIALGVTFIFGPLNILGVIVVIILASTCFASLSIFLASFLKNRERFMGVVQLITMPLFFASNAIYQIDKLPISDNFKNIFFLNPLYYVVAALRKLLIFNTYHNVLLDIGILSTITAIFVLAGSWGLKRLMD
jgi:ABC-2 type transport system permease protein